MNMTVNKLIGKLIPKVMDTFQIPGMSVAIIIDNHIEFCEGYGCLRADDSRVVDQETIFAAGSITKSTVAACLATLVEKKKVNWDDRVRTYLPEFSLFDRNTSEDIRVRDLLIHNSGLAETSGGTIWYGSVFSREEVVNRLKYLRPVTKFREAYAYQNVMYVVAGQVIEAITGMTWDQYFRHNFLIPLNLTRSCTSIESLLHNENVASPHVVIDGAVKAIPYMSHDNIGPAAALNTCAFDLARYGILFLSEGQYKGKAILQKSSIQDLFCPQIYPSSSNPEYMNLVSHTNRAFGLGWRILDYRNERMIDHSGGVDGMRALLTLLPDRKCGVVVLTNQEEGNACRAISFSVLDHILNQSEMDWVSILKSDSLAAREQRTRDEDQLRQIALEGGRQNREHFDIIGTFFDPLVGNVIIEKHDSGLRLSFENNPLFSASLELLQNNTYRIQWDRKTIPAGYLYIFQKDYLQSPGLQFAQPRLLDVDFDELHLFKTTF